ncbi:hypothetical protein ACFYZE_00930 [Streptomyces sp. NPDC001796]
MRSTIGEAGVWTTSAHADVRLAWADYGGPALLHGLSGHGPSPLLR